jgi:hypothetical protein
MIATLKVITILVTAFIGIFASLTNFRDHRGRITRHGWIGLLGVIAAGSSAAGLQLYSDAQQEKSVFAILSEIDRTLHPLPGLTVQFSLRPDWQKEGFRNYFNKMEASFDHATSFGSFPFPRREESPLLNYTVCDVNLALLFYREIIDPASFEYNISGSGEDLRIRVTNPCQYSNFPIAISVGRFSWDYDLRGAKLRRLDLMVDDRKIDSTSDEWKSNGKIASLHDLLGAQLIVQLDSPGYPVNAEFTRNTIQEYRQSIQLADLIIRLQNGIVMRFDADNLKRYSGKNGFAVYSFIFPKTMGELIKATQYDQFKKLRNE